MFTIVCSYCSTKSHFPLSHSHRRGNTRRVPSCCPDVTFKNHEHVLNIIRGFSYKEEKHFTIQKKLKWNSLTKSQNFFALYDVHITEKNNQCSRREAQTNTYGFWRCPKRNKRTLLCSISITTAFRDSKINGGKITFCGPFSIYVT